ncbi:MAG: hypothetical protein QOJ16_4070, partial [Acidobacteriota bacterium]|nr:hypothetical protein [Acidobacteriota bacterium]
MRASATNRELRAFFWRYARRYTGWLALAGVSILVFAAATAAIASLVKPIFGEVLLSNDMPSALTLPAEHSAGGVGKSGRPENTKPAAPLAHLAQKLSLAKRIDDGYQSLKRRLKIGPAEVVYFVPILF